MRGSTFEVHVSEREGGRVELLARIRDKEEDRCEEQMISKFSAALQHMDLTQTFPPSPPDILTLTHPFTKPTPNLFLLTK